MPKTILLVGNHLSTSGQNLSVGEELASRLDQIGYQTILVSRKPNKFARLLDMLWTIVNQRRFYDIAEVDVFSGPAFIWAYLSSILLKLYKKPFIITLHGGELPEFASHHHQIFSKFLKSANFVITPSKYLVSKFQLICPDIKYLPNAIDLNHYPYIMRSHLRPHIIWLRAFHEIYNPELAIQTLASISSSGVKATLTMVGPNKHDGSLERTMNIIEQFKLQNSVLINGAISKSDVPFELNKGDIFLNTTQFESFGVSVMEAAACGLCIVTTNVGELKYLWEDGIDAILVSPNNPEAMASAIKRILSEPELAKNLSENARKKAEQYDWSTVLPRWKELFLKL